MVIMALIRGGDHGSDHGSAKLRSGLVVEVARRIRRASGIHLTAARVLAVVGLEVFWGRHS